MEKCDNMLMGDRKMRLKRKIDNYLVEWKNDPYHLPLIIKGGQTNWQN